MPKKKQNKKTSPKTKNKPTSSSTYNSNRRIAEILLFAGGIFLLILLLFEGDSLWKTLHYILLGLFGPLAFIIPFAFIYLAVMSAFEKHTSPLRNKIVELSVLIILICSAVLIITSPEIEGEGFQETVKRLGNFKEHFDAGRELRGAGVAGIFIGAPLFAIFGKVGAIVTVFLGIFVFLMLITGATLLKIFKFISKSYIPDQKERIIDTNIELPEDKPPKFNIDVDLGPDFALSETEAENAARGKADEAVLPIEDIAMRAATENNRKLDEKSEFGLEMEKAKQAVEYVFPPVTLLKPQKKVNESDISEELKTNAARLVDTLRSFGVETRIIDISRGPTVTRYELQPSAGVKISKITSLADDIALNLAAAGVRIEAPIPNKAAVGIEVPNKVVSPVYIREIIDSKQFISQKSPLTVCLGKDISGNIAVADIEKMPHLLIAGATGSGKSVCINSLIISLIYKSSPDDVKLILIDPKVVELGIYNGIPHLLVPVVTDPRKAAGALNWAVTEMLNRYKLFAQYNVRDLSTYNKLAARNEELETLPKIVIIIDELADLMMVAPNEVEDAICRLAQMARAAGMHLVLATQRPSVDVITGVIKANIPSRIAFAVSSQVDSRTILDSAGAEKLIGKGDMLFYPAGSTKPTRLQGCFVSDKEIESVISFIKSNDNKYNDEIIEEMEKQAVKEKDNRGGAKDFETDEMFSDAVEIILESGVASTSFLQRRLKLGYARAARIIDELEERGILGPYEGSKPRQILITKQQWHEMNMNKDI